MTAAAPFLRRGLNEHLTQERIVLGTALALAAAFAVSLPTFATLGNAAVLLRNVSVLAILSLGAAVVVIGRGLDIAQVAIMTVSSAWMASLLGQDVGLAWALLLGLALALVCGALNGLLVAIVEIPPVFATLGTSILLVGLARLVILDKSLYGIGPDQAALLALGQGSLGGVPVPVLILAALAAVSWFFLNRMTWGRFVYALGDNAAAARLTGLPVRPLIVLTYVVSAGAAFLGGLVLAGSVASVNLSLASSTLIFDVLMVVVLGGVSLVGGRGGVGSVLAGALLIGVLLNGLVLMNVNSDVQDIVKGLVLLAAVVIDVRLHPRDEETARQGDL